MRLQCKSCPSSANDLHPGSFAAYQSHPEPKLSLHVGESRQVNCPAPPPGPSCSDGPSISASTGTHFDRSDEGQWPACSDAAGGAGAVCPPFERQERPNLLPIMMSNARKIQIATVVAYGAETHRDAQRTLHRHCQSAVQWVGPWASQIMGDTNDAAIATSRTLHRHCQSALQWVGPWATHK